MKYTLNLDFRDLNDTCLKNIFPPLKINTLIDATIGHEIIRFMDGFNGYNHS